MESTCQQCGRSPARNATFRAMGSLLVAAQVQATKGCYCRDCGLALFRHHTDKTLLLGWWGIPGLVGVPLTVALNYGELHSFKKLSQPTHAQWTRQTARFSMGSEGVSEVSAAPRAAGRPLDPGKPLARRVSPYLAPAVLVAIIIGWWLFIFNS